MWGKCDQFQNLTDFVYLSQDEPKKNFGLQDLLLESLNKISVE